jgi:hypothetical protein
MTSQVEGLARFDLSRRSAVQLLLLVACLLQGEFCFILCFKGRVCDVILHKVGSVEETLDLNIFYASTFLYCKIVTICSVTTCSLKNKINRFGKLIILQDAALLRTMLRLTIFAEQSLLSSSYSIYLRRYCTKRLFISKFGLEISGFNKKSVALVSLFRISLPYNFLSKV